MGHHISLNAHPRSGNSFLRKYLQNVLGIHTGSDMVLDQTINNQVNMAGEEITDASVWIKKTHDPYRSPMDTVIHKSNKIICIVRNPYDTLMSFLNLVSGDHSG